MLRFVISNLLFSAIALASVVQELTSADETSEVLSDNAMIFVMYRDTSHEYNEDFHDSFEQVAKEFASYQDTKLQWFYIDTLQYPEMEDHQMPRAIFNEAGERKSSYTGRPQGAYIAVIYQGQQQSLKFEYDAAQNQEQNSAVLKEEIIGDYLEPVTSVEKCVDVKRKVDATDSKPFSLVLFQKPIEDEEGSDKGRGHWVLTELARREQFLFKGRDLDFFWIADPSCITQFGGKNEIDSPNDVLVLITREKNQAGLLQNAPLVNREDALNMPRLNRWVNSVISDVELRFTDRIIHTVMDERMFALVLVRSGGKPTSDEDYENMLPDDNNAVTEFQKFAKTVKFKQQRMLLFYADPFEDKPIDDFTTIQEFFGIEFKLKSDLPALMLVDPVNEKLEFFQPIEDVTVDSIADLVGQLVFVDLFQSAIQQDAAGMISAHARSRPDDLVKPADPKQFRGLADQIMDEL